MALNSDVLVLANKWKDGNETVATTLQEEVAGLYSAQTQNFILSLNTTTFNYTIKKFHSQVKLLKKSSGRAQGKAKLETFLSSPFHLPSPRQTSSTSSSPTPVIQPQVELQDELKRQRRRNAVLVQKIKRRDAVLAKVLNTSNNDNVYEFCVYFPLFFSNSPIK